MSSTGPFAINEENIANNNLSVLNNNSGNNSNKAAELIENHNNIEENDEGQINLNYLEFLEDRVFDSFCLSNL